MLDLFDRMHFLNTLYYDFWIEQTKACLVALIALAIAHVIRRRSSASTRHLILVGAVIAILALPALAHLPSWRLLQITAPTLTQSIPISIGPPKQEIITMATPSVSGAFIKPTAHIARFEAHDGIGPPRTVTTYSYRFIPFPEVARDLSAAISMVMMIRIAWMLVGLSRLARKARPSGPNLREYLPAAMARVRIVLGGDAPMTWGCVRPILMMPSDAVDWPAERLRAVILHECAHIARQDWITQLLARLTCALCWFNPLAWRLAHQMRADAELACDDAVLLSGISSTDYAEHLLDVARLLKAARRAPNGAVAMASRSEIASRLTAILDANKPRALAPMRSRIAGLCAAGALIFVLGICGVRAALSQTLHPPTAATRNATTASPPSSASDAARSRALHIPKKFQYNFTWAKIPGDPDAAIAQLHRIYGWIQTYRRRNHGVYPGDPNAQSNTVSYHEISKGVFVQSNTIDPEFALMTAMAEAPQEYGLPEGSQPDVRKSVETLFLNPDVKFKSKAMVGSSPYMLHWKRVDGTPIGGPKPPGTRDLLAWTDIYVHQNWSYGLATTEAGFYLALWDDGEVEKIPWNQMEFIPRSSLTGKTVTTKMRYTEGARFEYALPGQPGLPPNTLTSARYHDR